MAGNGELNRIIKDLQKTVAELNHSYKEQNVPVTDGSRELHSLCAQLEFLLQFDLKEKRSFLGQRKDYWDFLCQGLARCRQDHEGVRFVTSLDKLKTPVGRGRAFLRYCLVHQQLAESLQLCLLDPDNLREWYYARSPFLSPQHRVEILGSLYELDSVTFHLALHRADLDTAWPMFSETLVRPRRVAGSSPAKTAPQKDDTSTTVHGCPSGINHPTIAPHGVPAHLCPPTLAALWIESLEVEDMERELKDVDWKKDMEEKDEEKMKDQEEKENVEEEEVEVQDVEVEEDMEEKDEEELQEDKKDLKDVDVEELEDAPSTGKALQIYGDGEPGTSPPPNMGCMLGSPPPECRQPGGMEASLQVLVSRLQTKLGQQETALQALAAQLAQEKHRNQHQEESSAQRAQLQACEAEALRKTNIFLEQALAEAVAAGEPEALAQAQEEAQAWREVAEERGAQLAAALAEVAALTSHLRDCQTALAAVGQTDTLDDASTLHEVDTIENVLRQALELACGPQEPPLDHQAEGKSSTATSMAMRLANLAATAWKEAQESQQQFQAQQQEVARLQEQLSRARQDGERWASALQRAQKENLEREATRGAEQARQQQLIRDMKGRLLELLREKDALWQKTEGMDTPTASPVPRDAGLCACCRKDFRLLSRRYSCRLCQGKVCQTCSVDMGKQGRCCLLCYQHGHSQAP